MPARIPSRSRSLTWSASTFRDRTPATATSASAPHGDGYSRGALCGRTLEDFDPSRAAVNPDPVAGRDALRGDRRSDHGRDAELSRQHGRMGGRAAGVGHETSNLREEHDPGRDGPLTDEAI